MEFPGNQAIYLQIADQVAERILSGSWVEGQRLPSIRELAAETEVNPNTVMRSYGYLQDLGLIHNRRGVGYFVSRDAVTRSLELRKKSFVRHELPGFFRAMDLLELECEELRSLYAEDGRGL